MARDWRFTDESLTNTVRLENGGRARGRRRDQGMNSTEKRYAEQLKLRYQVGEVLWWGYECITLKLGEDCRYTPDFCVMLASLDFRCIDTKATVTKLNSKKEPYLVPLCEDDSKSKIATAASLFPLGFYLAFQDADGNWIEKEVK